MKLSDYLLNRMLRSSSVIERRHLAEQLGEAWARETIAKIEQEMDAPQILKPEPQWSPYP